MAKITLAQEASDPSAPPTSSWKIYAKAGGIYIEDSSGNITGPLGAGISAGTFAFTGDNLASPNTTTGTQDNVAAVGYSVYGWNGGSASTIDGFTSGAADRALIVYNMTSSQTLTLAHEATGSTAANRLHLPNGASVSISPYQGVMLVYDATTSRWYLAGGGTSPTGTAPISVSGSAITFAPDTSTAKTTPVAADEIVIGDSASSFLPKKSTITQIVAQVGVFWAAVTAKTTPVGADTLLLADSAASNVSKSFTLTNLWTNTVGVLIAALTAKTTPVGADIVEIADSAASNATKGVTITNLFAQLGVLLHAFTAKTSVTGADELPISDSAASNVSKKITITNFLLSIFAAPALTGLATADEVNYNDDTITASGNAATIPVTKKFHTVTNNSAATLTITLTTTSAVVDQVQVIRILDASGVAQTLTFVNTENSLLTVPTTTNGSTTLPLTVVFMWNDKTSKWRYMGDA